MLFSVKRETTLESNGLEGMPTFRLCIPFAVFVIVFLPGDEFICRLLQSDWGARQNAFLIHRDAIYRVSHRIRE